MGGEMDANNLAEQASKLLDFSQKFDIQLLDQIVNCMYAGIGQQVCLFMAVCICVFVCHNIL